MLIAMIIGSIIEAMSGLGITMSFTIRGPRALPLVRMQVAI